MSLTGTALQVLLGAATIAAIIGAIWLTPRVRHSLSRFALLLPGQILGLVTLLVIGNAYFSFYNNWNDLTGQAPALPHSATAPGR